MARGAPSNNDVDQNTAIFDRKLLRQRRARAARGPDADNFLFDEVADRLAERLQDVTRLFDAALDLTARGSRLADALRTCGKVRSIITSAASWDGASRLREQGLSAFVADEEILPVQEGQFDLITSNLALHWINDLPGALVQINRALKPDGLFQGAILGGETLTELRHCLMDAELEVTGGASPRVSPMVDLRDAAGLLQRAGFALPVADLDRINVSYSDPFKLMADLRAMGETNAVCQRMKVPSRRALFLRAAQLYADRHSDPDGRVSARFEVIYLHGWRPATNQPQPLKPGSATSRLSDALETRELPL